MSHKCNCHLFFSSFFQKVPIDWEEHDVTPVKGLDGKIRVPSEVIESINRNKIGLKGPLGTPIGKGHVSLNLTLRR